MVCRDLEINRDLTGLDEGERIGWVALPHQVFPWLVFNSIEVKPQTNSQLLLKTVIGELVFEINGDVDFCDLRTFEQRVFTPLQAMVEIGKQLKLPICRQAVPRQFVHQPLAQVTHDHRKTVTACQIADFRQAQCCRGIQSCYPAKIEDEEDERRLTRRFRVAFVPVHTRGSPCRKRESPEVRARTSAFPNPLMLADDRCFVQRGW